MADTKERQSRMATSSINAPIKKDGAGGQYTWGAPMDVQDYLPVGVSHQQVQLQAAPVYYTQAPAQPMQVSIASAEHFPQLGGPAPVAMRQWGPPGGHTASQPCFASPLYVQSVAPIRTTVDFGPQHPRNTFAKVPTTTVTSGSFASAPMAIDWSQAGTSAIQQAMLHMPNPSHTGPYTTTHAAIPLEQLRAGPQQIQTMAYNQPRVAAPPAGYQAKPAYQFQKVTQARGR